MIILQTLFFIFLFTLFFGCVYQLYKNRNVDAYTDMRPSPPEEVDEENYNSEQLERKKVVDDLNNILKDQKITMHFIVDKNYGDFVFIYKITKEDTTINSCKYEDLEATVNRLLETS